MANNTEMIIGAVQAHGTALEEHLRRLESSRDVKTRAPMRLWMIEDMLVGLRGELEYLKGLR
jgi:hypothetical protein